MKSVEIFSLNVGDVSASEFVKNGLDMYNEFIEFAASEGYNGDGFIYGLVESELEKYGAIAVKICHAYRTFDLVEVGYSFPTQMVEVCGEKWYGGYLHTLCVSRKDDIETHPSTLLVSGDGLIIVSDWLNDSVFVRGCSKEEVVSQTTTPPSQAWSKSTQLLAMLQKAENDIVHEPQAELKKCHIALSAITGICKIFSTMENQSRYSLSIACSKYGASLDYSAGIKYLQTAGRILQV